MRGMQIDTMIIRTEQVKQLDEIYRRQLVAKVAAALEHSCSSLDITSTSESLTTMVRQGLNEAKKLRIMPDDERTAYVMLHIHHAAGAISDEHFGIMRRDIAADGSAALSYSEHFREQSELAAGATF